MIYINKTSRQLKLIVITQFGEGEGLASQMALWDQVILRFTLKNKARVNFSNSLERDSERNPSEPRYRSRKQKGTWSEDEDLSI